MSECNTPSQYRDNNTMNALCRQKSALENNGSPIRFARSAPLPDGATSSSPTGVKMRRTSYCGQCCDHAPHSARLVIRTSSGQAPPRVRFSQSAHDDEPVFELDFTTSSNTGSSSSSTGSSVSTGDYFMVGGEDDCTMMTVDVGLDAADEVFLTTTITPPIDINAELTRHVTAGENHVVQLRNKNNNINTEVAMELGSVTNVPEYIKPRPFSMYHTPKSSPPEVSSRDRCRSAPDISLEHHRYLERKCAEELRRISDEFHLSYCIEDNIDEIFQHPASLPIHLPIDDAAVEDNSTARRSAWIPQWLSNIIRSKGKQGPEAETDNEDTDADE